MRSQLGLNQDLDCVLLCNIIIYVWAIVHAIYAILKQQIYRKDNNNLSNMKSACA